MSTSGAPSLPSGRPRGPSRLWVWLSLGFVLLALFGWGFGLFLRDLAREFDGRHGSSGGVGAIPLLQSRVNMPFVVPEGDKFEVRVSLRNASTRTLELESIDLYNSLHDGFRLLTSPKGLASTSPGAPVEYFFHEKIPSGTVVEKVFEVEAGLAGLYTGDLDIWNDGDFNSFTITLEVTPAPAPSAAGASPQKPSGEDPNS